ncbi:type II secretion system major pseudopilin GspG [Sulfurimonas sp. MAG313]|nr:type II secretion system major pseudopilin GspG [Sulfurimonas sp. MAG313]MDF1880903.1 type II secretion system major pseudopilin GspG [Sulfurimonas sp. MAG313]
MKKRSAFTLIELLVVIVIIGLLASLVAPKFFGKLDDAKVKTAKAQVEMLSTSLDAFRLDTGRYPSTSEGLAILWKKRDSNIRGFNGPYLPKAVKEDPWGTPYDYKGESKNDNPYELLSFGANGTAGGSDLDADISIWE